jgi:hypothetical protein
MKKGEQGGGMPGKKSDKTEMLTGQNVRPLILKKSRFMVTAGRD